MKKIYGIFAFAVFLMLFGCTLFEDASKDLENKANTKIQDETDKNIETNDEKLECENRYWFDDDSTECGYKEFCGMYMYQSLRTFDNLEDCEEELAEILSETEEIGETSEDCLDMDDEEKWDCLIEKAEEDKNMAMCNQITIKDKRSTCIKTVAHILHDVSVCDVLTDNDDRLFCQVHSSAQTTGGMI
ncbi:MAG: hypothetical protein WC356_07710 [Candidatus Micrarchaeia archaeon]|jgi:hypothetical protein